MIKFYFAAHICLSKFLVVVYLIIISSNEFKKYSYIYLKAYNQLVFRTHTYTHAQFLRHIWIFALLSNISNKMASAAVERLVKCVVDALCVCVWLFYEYPVFCKGLARAATLSIWHFQLVFIYIYLFFKDMINKYI